jgi:hypothetical protein
VNEILLQAGPLRMVFLAKEGAVRWIHAGGHEVLRGINAPVRDRGWGTVPPCVEDLRVEQDEHAFRAAFVVRCRGGEVDFRWRGELTGRSDGTMEFTFEGEALADFARNRIGFCVLHPASMSGAPCAIEHIDGTVEPARFPEEIQPHQPARGIRAIRHDVAPGLTAEIRLEGDTFEMEDQRNWTDASFKTYCTPLALPTPVAITRGACIRQRVSLRLIGKIRSAGPDFLPPWAPAKEVKVTLVHGRAAALPSLGVGWNATVITDEIVAALRPLALDHLRVDLMPADERHRVRLRSAAAAAARLAVALELAVWVGDRPREKLEQLCDELRRLEHVPRVARWMIFDGARACTPPARVNELREILAETPFVAPIGGGAAENFAELNRERAIAGAGDFTVHAVTPQVHAGDDASLFESLPIQGLTVSAARRISGGRPVCISPLTLTRRWRRTDPGCPAFEGPDAWAPLQSDARFGTSLTAAWTLGSLAALQAAGAASVTSHEIVGPNGLLDENIRPRPLAAVFKCFAGRTDAAEAIPESRAEDGVAAVTFRRRSGPVLAVANLRSIARIVHVDGAWGTRVVSLAPHGIGCVEMSP